MCLVSICQEGPYNGAEGTKGPVIFYRTMINPLKMIYIFNIVFKMILYNTKITKITSHKIHKQYLCTFTI
jgi:hypothetical protein